jgi:hypothetical protein
LIPCLCLILALAFGQPLNASSGLVVMGRGVLRATLTAPAPPSCPVRPLASPYEALYPVSPASAALAPEAPLAVWLQGAYSKAPPAEQEWRFSGLALRPTTFLLARGSRLRWVNQDVVAHQPFAISEAHAFDCGRLAPGQASRYLRFDDHGPDGPIFIPVFCALHPWERATLMVMPNAYFAALPAQGGSLEWRSVPAGPCLLKAWRPGLHGGTKRLVLRAGQMLEAVLDLRGEDE